MTHHFKPHKGETEHKNNKRPCPKCGRNMRKIYNSRKVYKVMGRVITNGVMYACSFCQIKGMKKDFRIVRAEPPA